MQIIKVGLQSLLARTDRGKDISLTYPAVISSCTEICWRCEVPSVTEFTSITVLTLLLSIQAKPVTICTRWA